MPERDAATGVCALVRCHGEVHCRSGDTAPVLGCPHALIRAHPLVHTGLATILWELHARCLIHWKHSMYVVIMSQLNIMDVLEINWRNK